MEGEKKSLMEGNLGRTEVFPLDLNTRAVERIFDYFEWRLTVSPNRAMGPCTRAGMRPW